jgi:hypothetical protein
VTWQPWDGIDLVASDVIPPGKALIYDGKAVMNHEMVKRLSFEFTLIRVRVEVREIVRKGLAAAFPDLVLPPEKHRRLKSHHDTGPAIDLNWSAYR